MLSDRVRLLARPKLVLPLLSLVVSGSLIATTSGGGGPETPQRVAAASCTLNVPTRYAISSPYYEVPTARGADCAAAGVVDARWEARRSNGTPMAQLIFRWDYRDTWNIFDSDNLQVWTWTPTGATTADTTLASDNGGATGTPEASPEDSAQSAAATIPQNTPTTDVRMISKVELVPTDNETVEVWAQRYAIAPAGLINYGGRTGSIQQLNTASGGWFVLKSFTTNTAGRWTVDNLDNVVGEPGDEVSIRVVVYDGQYIFGSISPTYIGVICPETGPCEATKTKGRSFLGLSNVRTEPNLEAPGPLNPPTNR